MVAQDALHIAPIHGEAPLYLAPFGEEEMARVLPAQADSMTFMPIEAILAYSQAPKTFLAEEAKLERTQTWGMYPERITPAHFVGTISLTDFMYGTREEPVYTTFMREVGTFIIDPRKQGQGLGTIAKLAVIAHAYETQDTYAFQAWTSERNIGAQRSLVKIGFAHEGNYQYIDFPGGEKTQDWVLAAPRVQSSVVTDTDDPQFQTALYEGWQRYTARRQNLVIKKLAAA